MIQILQTLIENAEIFLNNIPETKGCHLFVRPNADCPGFVGPDLNTRQAEVVIGMDNPHTQESRVIFRKVQIYDQSTTPPDMMISILTQMALSDLISFALGQTIIMYRRAELEGKQLVDKASKELMS